MFNKTFVTSKDETVSTDSYLKLLENVQMETLPLLSSEFMNVNKIFKRDLNEYF